MRHSKRLSLLVLTFAVFVLAVPPSSAQETQPGDPCSVAGHYRASGGPETPDGHFLVCDGAAFQPILGYTSSGSGVMFGSAGLAAAPLHVWGEAIIGSRGLSCSAATKGALRYVDAVSELHMCNGSDWIAIAGATGVSAMPAGTDMQVQFNDGGGFGGDAGFVWDKINGRLGVGTSSPSTVLYVSGSTADATHVATIRNSGDGGELLNMINGLGNSIVQFNQQADGHAHVTFNRDNAANIFEFDPKASSFFIRGVSPHSAKLILDEDAAGSPDARVEFRVGGTAHALLAHDEDSGHLRLTNDEDADGVGDILFYTGATEKMRLTNAGNLGIGDADPAVALDIAGVMRAVDDAAACTTAGHGAIRFNSAGATLEVCNAAAWQALGGGATALDDLTDAAKSLTDNNLFVGHDGGSAGPTDRWNTGIGIGALDTLGGGAEHNTALGFNSLSENTSGDRNTAIGAHAGAVNTTGFRNSFFGAEAGVLNTTGDNNTFIGSAAGLNNTTARRNTYIGSLAGLNTETGSDNVFIGYETGRLNVARSKSTAIGYQAMRYAHNTITPGDSNNTAIGYRALRGSTSAGNNTGINNTALGHLSLFGNTSGSENVALGADALSSNTTGSNNVAIGRLAGNSNTTGSNNILIGFGAITPSGTTSNHLNIGNTIYADISTDQVGVGVTSPGAPLDVAGEIKFSSSGLACGAAQEGAVRYLGSGASPPWEFCNGSAWVPFKQPRCQDDDTGECYAQVPRASDDPDFIAANIASGVNILGVTGTHTGCAVPASCPNVGDVCADGSLFAGFMFYGTSCEALYVTNNNQSTASQWKTANGGNDISTDDYIDGKVNAANRGNGGAGGGGGPLAQAGTVSTANLNGAIDVAVSGGYAYVASNVDDSLTVIDISNPAAPTQVGFAAIHSPLGVAVSGNYAYVVSDTPALHKFDVSNPAAPMPVGLLVISGPQNVALSGGYAYVTRDTGATTDSLTVIDISNPAAPTQLGTVTSADLSGAAGVAVSGNYAYVASDMADSLSVIDVSNPAAPVQAGTVSSADLNGATSVAVSGNYAYVTARSADSLTVIDISTPAAPAQVGKIESINLDGATDVAVNVDYAYVTSHQADSLTVIDISTPAAPVQADTITSADLDRAQGVAVSGGHAYVAAFNADSLTVIDLGGSPIVSFPAFDLCETGGPYHGNSDWYLPARAELNLLWRNRAAIDANAAGSFTADTYWSSTEEEDAASAAVWRQSFGFGTQDIGAKTHVYDVRCVRR